MTAVDASLTRAIDGPEQGEQALPPLVDILRHPVRLAALRRTALLDTPAEEAFDRLTRLAVHIFDAPVALVTFVEEDRQFFKSCIGLPEPWASQRQTPLTHSFCQHPVASREPLVITDARADPRYCTSLAIPDLGVVTYAGVPLLTRDGYTLGSFCVIDHTPRAWTAGDVAILKDLAAGVMTEIELRTALQELEQARSAAEVALRVRTEFLAATSHELRTPLTHIKGFVSTLRQPDVEWDQATQQDFLAEVERETDRLSRMIADLLDMARIESGGLDATERRPIDPRSAVMGGLVRVRGLVGEHPVLVDIPAELPLVEVDAAQLEHVVANLVENAAKYAPPGTPIRIDGRLADGEVQLRVEDEGPGIPPEHLERAFDKFFRARSTAASGIPGTGLGLAICRGIVEVHAGRIWAENRAGGGARFVVALPPRMDAEGGR